MNGRTTAVYCLLSGVLALSGCSGSSKTLYHTLGASVPDDRIEMIKVARPVPTLGVGPVRLPALLDRQGVVLRKDQYTVEVSELHEWGGELEDEFTRALADRLQVRLPETQVRTVPWELEQTPKYQVSMTVSQFDGIPGKAAYLKGRWQLQLASNGKGINARRFELERPAQEDSVAALVRAQSRLVDDLAQLIVRGF